MYKKLVMFSGVACVAAAVFFSSSVNKSTTYMDLKNVVSINTANAECIQKSWWRDGRCLRISQFCVGDYGNNECSFGY